MSLILTSLLVAGGVIAGRWIAHGAQPPDAEDDDGEGDRDEPSSKSPPSGTKTAGAPKPRGARGKAPPAPAVDPFAAFSCTLGDVVMGAGGDEAWLAGALVFHEDAPAAVLFIAPDAGGDRAVFLRTAGHGELLWLRAVSGVTVAGEPPSALEHDGERYDRVRRMPWRSERHGTGAPDVGAEVIVAEYKALTGARLLVVVGGGTARTWHGMSLEPGMYDVLAAGKGTLEPS